LDTRDKTRGSLTQILAINEIEAFVFTAHSQQLLCGLAGSLRFEDINRLAFLQADYLGFRGALCQQHQRISELDLALLLAIKNQVKIYKGFKSK
jgi:uncharacterized protein (UPF0264 family)